MQSSDYKKMLDDLRSQYFNVLHRRDKLTEELTGIAKSIEGLAALTGDKSPVPDSRLPWELSLEMLKSWIKYMGFTDACRAVLRISPSGITPTEIRDMLEIVGFPVEGRTNIMVSIHVFLERAIKSEEVQLMRRPDGEKAYQWLWKNELTPPPEEMNKFKEYERLSKIWHAFGRVRLDSLMAGPDADFDVPCEGGSLESGSVALPPPLRLAKGPKK